MFYGILILIGCGLVGFMKMNGKAKPMPREIVAPRQASSVQISTRKAPAAFDDDDDADDDDEGGQWISKRHKVGTFPRLAGMVPLPGMSSVILKGTAYRVKEVKPFIEMMRADKPTVSLRFERETTNLHDKNAIRIWGTGSRGGEYNLGYVPAESAKAIADTYSETMPTAAEIVSSGYTSTGDAAYVKVRLLGPSAAERKKFMKQ